MLDQFDGLAREAWQEEYRGDWRVPKCTFLGITPTQFAKLQHPYPRICALEGDFRTRYFFRMPASELTFVGPVLAIPGCPRSDQIATAQPQSADLPARRNSK